MSDNGWGATFHRHAFNNEIHRDGGAECTQKGTPRTVYVFDPDYLAEHDRTTKAEAWDECLDEIDKNELNTEQARSGNPYRGEQA